MKRGFLKKRQSSIGSAVCSSQTRTPQSDDGEHEGDRPRCPSLQPCVGSFDDGVEERHQADDRQHGAERVEAVLIGSRDVGTKNEPGTRAIDADGRFTQNTEPQEKCSSRKPPVIGPMATPTPENPAHMAIARPAPWGRGRHW